MDKYVAFIPVRGGSKSIPLKNIREINGRPLVYWTLDAAVQCEEIDRVYLCTDSDEIRTKVEEYIRQNGYGEKLLCIDRPPETATDTASTESAMLYFGQAYPDFSHIILVQATSPLLQARQLSEAIASYETNGYDSLLSVVRQKRFCWKRDLAGYVPVNYDFQARPRRQEFDGYLVENGAFYINTRERMLRDECRLSGTIGVYEMDEETYFEIDELSDWIIIENLLKKREKIEGTFAAAAKKIKMLLTDCDGVLTDGGMYYSESGEESKKFNTKDGMGVQLLREHGIRFGIITSENVELVRRRAQKLKADICYVGVTDKSAVLDEVCAKYGMNVQEIAYIGDDVNDLPVLRRVGLPCSVSNAGEEIKAAVRYVTRTSGGQGAVREVAELILSNIEHGTESEGSRK